MAAKSTQEQDSNPQDLNLLYKSLGELYSEGSKCKEYTENVLRIALCFDLIEALPKI